MAIHGSLKGMRTHCFWPILWWGKRYVVERPDGDRYDVQYYRGKWHVDHFDSNAVMSCRAWYTDDPFGGFVWEVPTFDSFIQAVRWLKQNIERMV